MRTTRTVMSVAVGLMLVVATASGHHAIDAQMDKNRPVNFQGTVVKVEWVNPHVRVHFDVKKADGTVETWTIGGPPPSQLLRSGVTKDTVLPGTEVIYEGYQAKDGTRHGFAGDKKGLLLRDGKRLFEPPAAGTPAQF
jgi:hypothetical protein